MNCEAIATKNSPKQGGWIQTLSSANALKYICFVLKPFS